MPKIIIREVDNTGTQSLPTVANVVYIPGEASSPVEPTMYTSAKAFHDAVVKDELYVDDLSAKMAYNLLKMGMQVLYEGLVVTPGAESGYLPTVSITWKNL